MISASVLPMLGPDWMDPEYLVNTLLERWGTWALAGICLVILVETGLLFPFLPGDSLLFTVGLFIGTGALGVPLWVACAALFGAAFVGDQLGYIIGRTVGPKIFSRPDSRFFKQEYIDKTHAFFEKYGGRSIVLARFVPFVRTYIPVAAGVGKMHYAHFVKYNVIGALIWGVGVTVLGYLLGGIEAVRRNFELVVVLIVFVSVLPMVFEFGKAWLEKRRAGGADAASEASADSDA